MGIGAIVIAFLATALGLIHSHAASPDTHFLLGQTKLGIALIALAVLALGFGIAKEIKTNHSAKIATEKEMVRDEMLRKIYAEVTGIRQQTTNDETRRHLELVLERISAVASAARESDFSMSDFSRSNFRDGNFTEANFQGSIFRRAKLSGADLSEAYIDSTTRLPK